MSKDNVGQWDTDANDNTDVGGNNIAEGCPPSSINNAIRTVMAQIKTWYDNVPQLDADNDFSGANTFISLQSQKFTSSVASGAADADRGFRGTVDGSEFFSIYYDNTKTVMNSGGTGWFSPDPFTVSGEPITVTCGAATAAANRGVRFTIDGVEYGYILQENGGMLKSSSGYERTVIDSTERTRVIPEGFGVNITVAKTSVSDTGLGVFASVNGLLWANREDAVTAILKRSGTDGAVMQFGKTTTAVGSISVTATATSYNTSSDGRLKTDFQPISADLIDQVDVYDHAWKDKTERAHGVIAQDLFEVFPQAVTKGENPDDMWSVDYSKLVPILIASIKDLRARLAQVEASL